MARRASDAAPRPILVAVLDAGALGDAVARTAGALGRSPFEAAHALFEAGVDWIQLRDRSLEAAPLLALARALVEARDAATETVRAAGRDPQVIVNKRCDVALAAAADGVHLGVDAVDVAEARALFANAPGRTRRAGRSLHAVAELERALASHSPPDYVHLAPIWPPRSKPPERPPLGTPILAQAAALAAPADVQVIAQGGLDAERAGAAIRVGAAGIAVTGLLTQAVDPLAAARALRAALDRAAASATATAAAAPPRAEPRR